MVRPADVRGMVQVSRYTNNGLAGTNRFRVADLTDLERQGRIKIHRGPVRREGGRREIVATRQILLIWSPRWFPSEGALLAAELNATPWPQRTR